MFLMSAPDTSPTGTAVLNGLFILENHGASPGYDGVLNVSSNCVTKFT